MVNVAAFASISTTLALCAGWTVWQFQSQQQPPQRQSSSAKVRRTTTTTATHTAAAQEFQAVHELLEQGDHESAESYLYVLENDEGPSSRFNSSATSVTDDRYAQQLLHHVAS